MFAWISEKRLKKQVSISAGKKGKKKNKKTKLLILNRFKIIKIALILFIGCSLSIICIT